MIDPQLRLKPSPPLNRRLIAASAVLAVLSAAAAHFIVAQRLAAAGVWIGWSATVSAIAIVLAFMNSRRGTAACACLQDTALVMPLPRGFGRRRTAIPLTDLRSIELTRRAGERLSLNLPGRFPVILRSCDVDRGDLVRFHDRLAGAAAAVNPELVRAQRLLERRNRPPLAALAICTVALVAYFLTSRQGGDAVHRAIVLGGLNDWLIDQGEIYRLGAAALLHSGWPHVIANVALLAAIALRLEYVTGPLRFAGAFATGAIAGNVGAWLAGGQTVVVGASGGVCGVMALYAGTLWRDRRHLPTRTQFAPNYYLTGALLLLFVPLPGYAVSAHVAGFLGGLPWWPAPSRSSRPHRVQQWLAAAAWLFIIACSGFAFAHAAQWLRREPAIMAQMARDPAAGVGSLNLAGWYALRHHDRDLMELAAGRLTAMRAQTPDSAGTLAELQLSHGDAEAAARYANLAYELRSDDAARELLVKAELAAYRRRCRPMAYGGDPVAPPHVQRAGRSIRFAAPQPVYVHALIGDDYVMARSGLWISGTDRVTVLGYSTRLPWRRKPRRQRLAAGVAALHCAGSRS